MLMKELPARAGFNCRLFYLDIRFSINLRKISARILLRCILKCIEIIPGFTSSKQLPQIQYNIYIERLFTVTRVQGATSQKMFSKEPSLMKAFEGSELCGCPDILWQTIQQMRPTCRESPVAIRWSRAYGSQTKTRRRRPRTARGPHKWRSHRIGYSNTNFWSCWAIAQNR
jgi:hypothetical protein